ncbi:MAG: NUDIX domain-containing protein, partial [Candidatus Buchananbacteria bacterium]
MEPKLFVATKAFINFGGKILIIRESNKYQEGSNVGQYAIVGGRVKPGQNFLDSLRREVKEETGLDVYDVRFIHYQDFIYDPIFHKKKHFIFLDFSCKTDKSDNVTLNDECEKYAWFKPEEALKMPLNQYTKKTIQDY